MKKCFLGYLFLLTTYCFAEKNTPVALPAALAGKMVQASAMAAGGLGQHNLTFSLQNKTGKEIKVLVPAGLHFKAEEKGAQDLLLLQDELIVMAPNEKKMVPLTGYCMQAHNFGPGQGKTYVYSGFAPLPLKTLSDSLKRYPSLAEDYGQMFVWALTDKRSMYDLTVEASLTKPATNIMTYVARASGLNQVNVYALGAGLNKAKKAAPRRTLFSKKAILPFHNPKDQAVSFKIYDAEGKVYHTLFENKRIPHGMKEYTYGINELVAPGTMPVFYAKITDATGKVLAEQKVDKTTEAVKPKLTSRSFDFIFELKQAVKKGKLNVYRGDGTLVEEFKRYEYLPVGNYKLQVTLLHLLPSNTKFIVKLESEAGEVYAQQSVENR